MLLPYYFWFTSGKQSRINQEAAELQAVSRLKINQLQLWHRERQSDAKALSENLALFLESPGSEKKKTLAKNSRAYSILRSFLENYHYHSAVLYGAGNDMPVLAFAGEAFDSGLCRQAAILAKEQNTAIFTDLLEAGSRSYTRMYLSIPVARSGLRATGYLVLVIDLSTFLLPTVSLWPNESIKSEAILTRFSGDTAFMVNAHPLHPKYHLQPFTYSQSPDLPIMRYYKGQRGLILGYDYSGKYVLAIVEPVGGTSWYLLVKSDADEVFKELYIQTVYAAVIIILASALIALFVVYLQRRKRQLWLQQQLDAEQKNAHLRYAYENLFEQANDAVIISDDAGVIVNMNERALALYGYTRATMPGINIRSLFTGENANELAERLLSGRFSTGQLFEAAHRRADGGEVQVEISSRQVLLNGRPCVQSIVRDVSMRKQDEMHIRRLTRFLTVLSGVNKAIISIHDRKELIDTVCSILHETGGIASVHLVSIHPVSGRPELYASKGRSNPIPISGSSPAVISPWLNNFLRQGTLQIFNSPEEIPEDWLRNFLFTEDVTSVLASVISLHPKVNGLLLCGSTDGSFFTPEETAILKEISDDIGYGLQNIHAEQQRRKAEELLQRSQKLLQETGKIAKIGGWEYDYIRKSGRWTEEVALIFETTESFSVPPLLELPFYTPAAQTRITEALARSIAGSTTFDEEITVTTSTGAAKWIRIIGRPVVANGDLEQIYCSVQDITTLKAAQKGLEESEKRYRLLAENISDVIWSFDLNTQAFTYISPSIKALRGLTPEEAMAERLEDALLPDSLAYIANETPGRIAIYMQGQQLKYTDVVLQPHKDGPPRWIEINSMFATNPENNHIEVIATSRDVTQKLIDEQKLRDSEEEYRSLFANMLNGLAQFEIREEQGIMNEVLLRDANEAFRAYNSIGSSGEGLISTQVWLTEHKGQLIQRFKEAAANGGRCRYEEYLHKTGLWMLVSIYSPREGQYILIEEDITDQKNAEEALRLYSTRLEATVEERTGQLQTANKELESFAYSVSHDLRAPLRTINGFSRILQADFAEVLPHEATDLLGDIQRNAIRMTQLIDDLLEFSRMSRKEVNKTLVLMERLFNEVFQELSGELCGRTVEFNLTHLPDAYADYALIRQVLVNLLTNALKYTSKRAVAVIHVSGSVAEGFTRYRIADNGAGFDMKYIGKLFGVFSRLHGSDEFEGTGVGLAIVKRILLHHGGDIVAEAAIEKGATFTFTLPVRKQAE